MKAEVTSRLTTDATATTRWADRLRRSWKLVAICVVFTALRLPVAWRQIPAQDEDYFAVPGLTILREGIPRIPYMPSRNPKGAFYKADEMLFTLPPLYFYWQALVYVFVGPSTAAARLASMLCGVAAIVVVFQLALIWLRHERAALWSAGLFAASRVVYFPVLIARPDMLLGLLGLTTLLAVAHWNESRRALWLLAAGVAIGANALTHPFAIVPAIQATVWVLIASGNWRSRIRNVATLAVAATPVFLLWGVLIVQNPEAFRLQFSNAVLNQSGPGLISRLIMPLESLRIQWPIFLEHVGRLQAVAMLAGVVAATVVCVRRPTSGWRTLVALTWSAMYLHVAFVGRHPTKGYWCYTGALMFLCLGGVVARVLYGHKEATESNSGLDPSPRPSPPNGVESAIDTARGGEGGKRSVPFATLAGLGIAVAVMLPGAGLRTVVAHLRHWDDVNYDATRFTQELMQAVPADAKLVVDPGYIFDFYRAGRDVTLGLDYPFFFSVRGTEYDYVVGGPYSIRDKVPEALDAQFVRAYGDREDLFACYAEVYRATEK